MSPARRSLLAVVSLLALLAAWRAWSESASRPHSSEPAPAPAADSAALPGAELAPAPEPEPTAAPAPAETARTSAPAAPAASASPPGGALRVRVVDGAGAPVAGLSLRTSDADGEDAPPAEPTVSLGYRWRRAVGATDAAGRLTLHGLEPGRYRVAAGAPPAWAYSFSEPIEVRAESGAEVTLRVAPPPADRLIAGVVFQPSGEPVKRALVEYGWTQSAGRYDRIYVWTGAGGSFALVPPAEAMAGMLRAEVHGGALRSATLAPVDAGTVGHVIRLGPQRLLELDVRGTDGEPLDRFQAGFTYQLGEQWVQDYPGPRKKPGEPLLWDLPTVPVRITVRVGGFDPYDSGVLDPEQLGDVLTVWLEADPVVSGRVLFEGSAAPYADVWLEWIERDDPDPTPREPLERRRNWNRGVRTNADESGAFRRSVAEPGWYRAVAWQGIRGGGESEPFEVTEAGASEVVVELSVPPATLRGRVLLPPGHDPEEVWLVASTGAGYRELHRAGTYELPGLKPGPCTVSARESLGDLGDWLHPDGEEPGHSWFNMSHGPSAPPSWMPAENLVHVDLAPGEVRELDLDLVTRPECWLEGRIDLGRPIAQGLAELFVTERLRVALVRPEDDEVVARSDLDAEGRFALGAREPGLYRLELDLELEVHDTVSLVSGTRTWEAAIELGALDVLPAEGPGGRLTNPPTHLEWIGPGDLRARVLRNALDKTTYVRHFALVPAGTVQVLRGNGYGWEQEERKVLGEVRIEAGERTEFAPPREDEAGDAGEEGTE